MKFPDTLEPLTYVADLALGRCVRQRLQTPCKKNAPDTSEPLISLVSMNRILLADGSRVDAEKQRN
jgi:hypothetical protein